MFGFKITGIKLNYNIQVTNTWMLLTKSTGDEIWCITLCRTIGLCNDRAIIKGCLGVFVNGSYGEERLCWKATTNTKHNWCILIRMKHFSRSLFIFSPWTFRSSGALYRGWALTGEERFQNNLHSLGFNPYITESPGTGLVVLAEQWDQSFFVHGFIAALETYYSDNFIYRATFQSWTDIRCHKHLLW